MQGECRLVLNKQGSMFLQRLNTIRFMHQSTNTIFLKLKLYVPMLVKLPVTLSSNSLGRSRVRLMLFLEDLRAKASL
ncbi:putative orf1 protein [Paenibacillus macerans]|uniref:Putative orf1 protein n=1 Tax=Paenibacillus macerans TaxID=44252 RepID=A0A090ZMT2_PAEMA|nr:putative orf1 protein [Paenibacillus macerans]